MKKYNSNQICMHWKKKQPKACTTDRQRQRVENMMWDIPYEQNG